MKKLILALAMMGLLVGCASHEGDTGGTSDQYNTSSGNNTTKGTGTSMTTNINQNNTSP